MRRPLQDLGEPHTGGRSVAFDYKAALERERTRVKLPEKISEKNDKTASMKMQAPWILLMLLLAGSQQARATSYLNDYFLPTAKLALNKLQQSLSTQPATMAAITMNASEQSVGLEPPAKGEFVKLEMDKPIVPAVSDTRDGPSESPTIQAASSPLPPPEPNSAPVSTILSADDSLVSTMATDGTDEPASTTTVGSTTTTSTQVSTETTSSRRVEPDSTTTLGFPQQQQQQQVVESKSAEESVRETEMEAMAAVDASIGFGDLFASMSDACYDEYGNARYCEPDFVNAALERPVEVSSECGTPPSRFCTAYSDQIRNCHICDAQHPKKRHPAAYLTDLNNANQPSCWVSAPISTSLNGTGEPNLRSDNVSLTLNLDKKYEITYVSMQFCSIKPDSLAIYKSSDFGRTWSPYQFFSSQCRRLYNRPAKSGPPALAGDEQPEASCFNSSSQGHHSARIAFSTLEGRAGQQLDKSAALQDWITATNIRIVLDRHQASWIQAHAYHSLARNSTGGSASEQPSTPELENSLTSPSDTYNYALSDLTVGGRCKCNGHASRCILSRDGRQQCDCRHNTAGRDCEKCAPFHFDRPWARASQLDANPCQPCNCNGHSRKCRFDAEIYRLSGKRSGGVCINCKDNTAGRHCHYCREGFTRDHSKPMSAKEACKHCDCHPIGSVGRACNQTTGQCPCKEGVTGLQCNRCAPGYQQSSSLSEPCIKLPENDINYEPSLQVDGGDSSPAIEPQNPPADGSQEPQNVVLVEPDLPPGARPPARQPVSPAGGKRPPSKQPDYEPDEALGQPPMELDKQDDDSEALLAEELGHKRRIQQHQHQLWSNQKQRKYYQTLYGSGHRTYMINEQPGLIGDEEDEDQLQPPRSQLRPQFSTEDQRLYVSRGGRPLGGSYQGGYSKQRFVDDYASNRNRRPLRPGMHSMDAQDELTDSSYNPMLNGASYGDDQNFNQIRVSKQGHKSQLGRHRQFSVDSPDAIEMGATTCGECQSATRRLVLKQFCHLDYAIKATVLNKFMANDWTKFELEVQDIFKSPTGAEQPAAESARGSPLATNYIDNSNSMQADEAELRNRTINSQPASSSDGQVDQQQQQQQPTHRIRIGTVQTIWVPTEDLTCRCPRLKLGATYLLLGSIDAKENSLQLDRHGLALEWRSSLQDKLIKYQRRQSRGRC